MQANNLSVEARLGLAYLLASGEDRIKVAKEHRINVFTLEKVRRIGSATGNSIRTLYVVMRLLVHINQVLSHFDEQHSTVEGSILSGESGSGQFQRR